MIKDTDTMGAAVPLKMGHIPALDGLRAIAILLVLVAHAGLGRWVPGGFGVTIFFFLSGYLITSLMRVEAAQHGRIDLKQFYIRRALRIFPPFYLVVGTMTLLSLIGISSNPVQPTALAADVLFLTNYGEQLGVPNLSGLPLWSLDVEEHFYILFSVLFAVVFVRMTRQRALLICLLICVTVLAVRVVHVVALGDIESVYFWSHTRLDSILFGCMMAIGSNPALDENAWRPRRFHIALAFGVLVACFLVRDAVFRETLRYTLQGIALFVLFSAALQARGVAGRILSSTPMRITALLSYSLYLVHMPLRMMAERFEIPLPALSGTLASFAVAWVIYILVERPIVRWRRATQVGRRSSASVPSGLSANSVGGR